MIIKLYESLDTIERCFFRKFQAALTLTKTQFKDHKTRNIKLIKYDKNRDVIPNFQREAGLQLEKYNCDMFLQVRRRQEEKEQSAGSTIERTSLLWEIYKRFHR